MSTKTALSDRDVPPDLDLANEPDKVMELISDVLSRQRLWQKQQAQSEQLIAKMADQLEQSQRLIENLSRANEIRSDRPNEHKGTVSSAATPSSAVATTTDAPAEMSWEKQKALLMADLNGPSDIGSSATEPEIVAPGDSTQVRIPSPESPPPLDKFSKPAASDAPDDADNDRATINSTRGTNSLSREAELERKISELPSGKDEDLVRWLKRTLEERLRESEIEVSIERAKLARERSELNQLREEFETQVRQVRDEELEANSRRNGRGRSRSRVESRWDRFLNQ